MRHAVTRHRHWKSSVGLLLALAGFAAADGNPRLADAVQQQNAAAVRVLLGERADVNQAQGDGATALHWAAHWDDRETAALLLKAGAKVNAATDQGITPLMQAALNGSTAFAETDLDRAYETTIADLMSGQHCDPLRVVMFNTDTDRAEDVLHAIAQEILRRLGLGGRNVPSVLEDFIDCHVGPDRQLTLRLGLT